MKIIFFGDIVGRPGREAIKKILPKWQEKYQPDLIIANGDNLAHGKGITKDTFNELLDMGVDIVTSGDHNWSQKQVISLLENKKNPIIRPANFPEGVPGEGYKIIEVGSKKVLVINLIGRVFMAEQYDDPFRKADEILKENEDIKIVIIDWHTEATAEKVCLGWYLDGRVSAILGTHTHIPTADEKILPNKTAYISDAGMVGAVNSSLGMDKQVAINRFLTQMKQKYEVATKGPIEVNAVLLDIKSNGEAKKIERIQKVVDY